MWSSFRSLSSLAREINPGAQSVTTEMGPGCRIGVVSLIIPDLRSIDFSDLRIVEETMEVKWSISSNMFCPSLLITST